MYTSRYRVAYLQLVPVRDTKHRIPIEQNATAYAKPRVSISCFLTELVQLQDWREHHVMNLQAHSDQPRDLEAGLSLPEHPDVSPVRLILAAYPLADLDGWCRASTDYFAKPEEI